MHHSLTIFIVARDGKDRSFSLAWAPVDTRLRLGRNVVRRQGHSNSLFCVEDLDHELFSILDPIIQANGSEECATWTETELADRELVVGNSPRTKELLEVPKRNY